MRCKACNSMMAVRKSKYGGFEDMCSRCIGWATAYVIDSDLIPDRDSCPQTHSLSEVVVFSELGISIDITDEYDTMSTELDRNHELPDIFDSYEE